MNATTSKRKNTLDMIIQTIWMWITYLIGKLHTAGAKTQNKLEENIQNGTYRGNFLK